MPLQQFAPKKGQKRQHKFAEARGFWLWLLDVTGMDGCTTPWRTIHLRTKHLENYGLIVHELVHVDQINRHGPVWFSILYVYYLARYGYSKSPMEIEAYTIGQNAERLQALIAKYSSDVPSDH